MSDPVGIESINAYCGLARLSVPSLFEERGLDLQRLPNVLMRHKSVALGCEDTLTYAVNAARPLLDGLDPAVRASIELLVVATESGLDYSKSVAATARHHLELPRSCRVIEVKQACSAGVTGLHLAASAVAAARPGVRALVIAADVPVLIRGTYIEPSQGAGAVAVLVGREPALCVVDPAVAGLYTFDVADFLRPTPDEHLWDIDLSLMCFIECLREAYLDYAARSGSKEFDHDFDQLAMHTPFPGMVKGAHRALQRTLGLRDPAAVEADFRRRLEPSLRYPAEVGNIYAATALLALASASDALPPGAPDTSVGLFAYGSGCASEFWRVRLPAGAGELSRAAGIATHLDSRAPISVGEYDRLADDAVRVMPGARDAVIDRDALAHYLDRPSSTRPLLTLAGIRGHRREYSWWKGRP
ncbi:polyketide biosynthesis 3-hydroxy-3-methylglutaryl-CoA synthase-like enzyme PksG [Allocatelliglobosispora scoriae]|uniref:Polyketide biosynthesis 3-hydroxy-3-methylglutaryl-CoA synthase-like enzyme PksG n=1 Tax=Allocatelliglobosispora scoriae TaxID=643052 RepID=A0A841BLM2_9ACTN|nr:hydroxymethylglutaryl-CoA synthase family protein [Allocatelliglobosispora scoriae]MBB5867761.1 polyketide biosynthesis 3-hydroxy-3-methylglutaryl-CoA synthase-like enzyme PksG [Allocatelliglobosispora scoriae]